MTSSSTARPTLQVNPLGDQWAVCNHRSGATTKIFRTKQEAEHCAFQLAMKRRPCEVAVSEGSGTLGYRQIFGMSGDFENPARPSARNRVNEQHGLLACLYGLLEKHDPLTID
jgi:hypothetical protein